MKSIYKLTNTLNNKIYIGLTVQGVRTRFLHHLYEARSNSSFAIHNSIRKHGEENFEISILFESNTIEDNDLKELEKYYIKLYQSNNRKIGYNLTEGGDGTLGYKLSEETKNKIREKALGRKISKETKERMKISALKRTTSKEFKQWKKEWSKGNLKLSKPITLVKNNIIYNFKSLSEASRQLNISIYGIRKLLKNEYSEYKGYQKASA